MVFDFSMISKSKHINLELSDKISNDFLNYVKKQNPTFIILTKVDNYLHVYHLFENDYYIVGDFFREDSNRDIILVDPFIVDSESKKNVDENYFSFSTKINNHFENFKFTFYNFCTLSKENVLENFNFDIEKELEIKKIFIIITENENDFLKFDSSNNIICVSKFSTKSINENYLFIGFYISKNLKSKYYEFINHKYLPVNRDDTSIKGMITYIS